MCLIIHGSAAHLRRTLLDTKGLLADIFQSNSDGVGAMHFDGAQAVSTKSLPRSLKKLTNFIKSLPGDDRELAVHFRYTTHGHTDKENCHPYAVAGGGFMMHNGVLSTGNKADPARSDTWHYCRAFLDNQFGPEVHGGTYNFLTGEFIGASNRFVFLTPDGEMSIVNKDTGVEIEDLWFSNTYAWSPEILDPSVAPKYSGHWGSVYGTGKGGYGDWDLDDMPHKWSAKLDKPRKAIGAPADTEEDEGSALMTGHDWGEAFAELDMDSVYEGLRTHPRLNLMELFDYFEVAALADLDDLGQALWRGDINKLAEVAREAPDDLAQAIFDQVWVELETGRVVLDISDAYPGPDEDEEDEEEMFEPVGAVHYAG